MAALSDRTRSNIADVAVKEGSDGSFEWEMAGHGTGNRARSWSRWDRRSELGVCPLGLGPARLFCLLLLLLLPRRIGISGVSTRPIGMLSGPARVLCFVQPCPWPLLPEQGTYHENKIRIIWTTDKC